MYITNEKTKKEEEMVLTSQRDIILFPIEASPLPLNEKNNNNNNRISVLIYQKLLTRLYLSVYKTKCLTSVKLLTI